MAKSVQILPEFYSAWLYFKSDTTTEIAVALGSLVVLATGPLLWVLAKPLSRWTLRDIAGDHRGKGVTAREIHAIAIATVGLIIVILNLPRLVALAWQLFYSSESASLIIGEARVFKEQLITNVIQETLLILLGTTLMVRVSFWVQMLSKLRNFGYDKTPS